MHSYGYKPSKLDPRDLKFTVSTTKPLPPKVDLRELGTVSPVRDQGQLGSCTGFAETALREHLELKHGQPLTVLSPLFLYYEERSIEHTVGQDAGAEPRDGFKTLLHTGCAPETDDIYNTAKFAQPPSASALTNAAAFKIAAYHRLTTLRTLKACLAGGSGVVLGFTVYASFEENERLATRGIMPMPAPGEEVLGGHAVFCCGYDDANQWLIIKNSWASDWGDQGFFYMPYGFVTRANVSDMWAASL